MANVMNPTIHHCTTFHQGRNFSNTTVLSSQPNASDTTTVTTAKAPKVIRAVNAPFQYGTVKNSLATTSQDEPETTSNVKPAEDAMVEKDTKIASVPNHQQYPSTTRVLPPPLKPASYPVDDDDDDDDDYSEFQQPPKIQFKGSKAQTSTTTAKSAPSQTPRYNVLPPRSSLPVHPTWEEGAMDAEVKDRIETAPVLFSTPIRTIIEESTKKNVVEESNDEEESDEEDDESDDATQEETRTTVERSSTSPSRRGGRNRRRSRSHYARRSGDYYDMEDEPIRPLYYGSQIAPDQVSRDVADKMARDLSYFHGRDGLAQTWSRPSIPPSSHPKFQKVWNAIRNNNNA